MTDTMPWKGIVKATAAFGLLLTGMCAVAVQDQKRQHEQENQYRWTDKNRWER